MPTKATIKLIKQLQQKKYRKKHQLFVVEGKKSIQEFMNSAYEVVELFGTEDQVNYFPSADTVTSQEMNMMSALSTPPNILAVFKMRETRLPQNINQIYFALDGIQDPGNLGTIIRLADWFGMNHIFCAPNTVDVYNPKVIQASMGSLTRVELHYVHLPEIINRYKIPILGTFMDGENVFTTRFPEKGLLVMGNEANGISSDIEVLCSKKICIPQQDKTTESLNVAMASGIIAAQIFAQNFK